MIHFYSEGSYSLFLDSYQTLKQCNDTWPIYTSTDHLTPCPSFWGPGSFYQQKISLTH